MQNQRLFFTAVDFISTVEEIGRLSFPYNVNQIKVLRWKLVELWAGVNKFYEPNRAKDFKTFVLGKIGKKPFEQKLWKNPRVPMPKENDGFPDFSKIDDKQKWPEGKKHKANMFGGFWTWEVAVELSTVPKVCIGEESEPEEEPAGEEPAGEETAEGTAPPPAPATRGRNRGRRSA